MGPRHTRGRPAGFGENMHGDRSDPCRCQQQRLAVDSWQGRELGKMNILSHLTIKILCHVLVKQSRFAEAKEYIYWLVMTEFEAKTIKVSLEACVVSSVLL